MVSRSAKTVLSSFVIAGGFVLVFFLTAFVERERPPLPGGYEDEDIALQGSRFKGFVFGAEGLLADWYWMNSLQYIGKKISSAKRAAAAGQRAPASSAAAANAAGSTTSRRKARKRKTGAMIPPAKKGARSPHPSKPMSENVSPGKMLVSGNSQGNCQPR